MKEGGLVGFGFTIFRLGITSDCGQHGRSFVKGFPVYVALCLLLVAQN